MSTSDAHNLQRFLDAQAGSYKQARRELSEGTKRSHWIWYIFPQMKGLGTSATAEFFGIGSLEEARAYLSHHILGGRLEQVTRLMLDQHPRSPHDVLGSPDDLKFRSSMTLFAHAAGADSIYQEALDKLCECRRDNLTLELLQKPTS